MLLPVATRRTSTKSSAARPAAAAARARVLALILLHVYSLPLDNVVGLRKHSVHGLGAGHRDEPEPARAAVAGHDVAAQEVGRAEGGEVVEEERVCRVSRKATDEQLELSVGVKSGAARVGVGVVV